MLRRNGLISDADIETLASFLDRFSSAVMCLLEPPEVGRRLRPAVAEKLHLLR